MGVSNPNLDEIRSWAYSSEPWPHDEWDLFLAWKGETDLYIQLATDPVCPKQRFFLHQLYYLAGYRFTQMPSREKHDRLEAVLASGCDSSHPDIQLWVCRCEQLMRGQLAYQYADWRGGGFAGYVFS